MDKTGWNPHRDAMSRYCEIVKKTLQRICRGRSIGETCEECLEATRQKIRSKRIFVMESLSIDQRLYHSCSFPIAQICANQDKSRNSSAHDSRDDSLTVVTWPGFKKQPDTSRVAQQGKPNGTQSRRENSRGVFDQGPGLLVRRQETIATVDHSNAEHFPLRLRAVASLRFLRLDYSFGLNASATSSMRRTEESGELD